MYFTHSDGNPASKQCEGTEPRFVLLIRMFALPDIIPAELASHSILSANNEAYLEVGNSDRILVGETTQAPCRGLGSQALCLPI